MSNKKEYMEGYVDDIIGHLVYVEFKSWDEWYALKTWGVDFEEKSLVGEIYIYTSSALKILSEGNTVGQKRLRLFSLSLHV